ncbi:hypothetical protein [Sphingobacterium spiritivorum]|nr:hypothetical protein [Sphingobacterium spiritivorum]SUJ11310.1 Uncharacterised protein [Sphingobacterium spiritivorum]
MFIDTKSMFIHVFNKAYPFPFHPIPSAMLTRVIVTVVSYILQKTFSFKGKKRLIGEH